MKAYFILMIVLFTNAALHAQEKFAYAYPELYIGKTLTMKPASKNDSIYGYRGFYNDFKKLTVYEDNGKGFTTPDKLSGKSFKVKNVIFQDGLYQVLEKNGPTAKRYYLELENPATGTIFYSYSNNKPSIFNFITSGPLIPPCEFYKDAVEKRNINDTKAAWSMRKSADIRTAEETEESFLKPMVSMFVNPDNSFDGLVEISVHEMPATGKDIPLTLVSKDGKKLQTVGNVYIVPASQYIKSSYTIVSFKLYKKEVDWLSKNLVDRIDTNKDKTALVKPNFLQCAVKMLYSNVIEVTR
jgi:hypothetical protein